MAEVQSIGAGVYVGVSALGFAVVMAFVLRDVRVRYVESSRGG